MTSTVQKWGNSLALRLPKSIAQELAVGEGDAVELKIRGDSLQVKPARREYRLSELLSKVGKKNLHSETNWGESVGKEVW
jgi:antitoxin MazE